MTRFKSHIHTGLALNSLRPRPNRSHFAEDTFKHIFLNENVRISIKISLNFAPKGPINNNPALVQIMAWRRPGDKPLSEPMMVSLLTHICVTRPQWVKQLRLHWYLSVKQNQVHIPWDALYLLLHSGCIYWEVECLFCNRFWWELQQKIHATTLNGWFIGKLLVLQIHRICVNHQCMWPVISRPPFTNMD